MINTDCIKVLNAKHKNLDKINCKRDNFYPTYTTKELGVLILGNFSSKTSFKSSIKSMLICGIGELGMSISELQKTKKNSHLCIKIKLTNLHSYKDYKLYDIAV